MVWAKELLLRIPAENEQFCALLCEGMFSFRCEDLFLLIKSNANIAKHRNITLLIYARLIRYFKVKYSASIVPKNRRLQKWHEVSLCDVSVQ
jgi:hypothetical protein